MTVFAVRLPSLRLSVAAALALILAACSGRDGEPEQNAAAAAQPTGTTVEIPEVAVPAIPVEPATNVAVNAAVEEEPVPADVQMQEDADATGMTSRLPAPSEEQAPAATE